MLLLTTNRISTLLSSYRVCSSLLTPVCYLHCRGEKAEAGIKLEPAFTQGDAAAPSISSGFPQRVFGFFNGCQEYVDCGMYNI